MSKILFTLEQIEKIIHLYTIEGKTQTEIGSIMGCGIKPIIRVLHENNIPTNIRRTNRRLKENYFSNIDTSNKAYFLGLLFADGNVSKDNTREAMIKIQLLNEDRQLLEKFKSEIMSDGTIMNAKGDTCALAIRSNQMAMDLEQFGIIPNKTYETHFLPNNIPSDFLIDFLRGYVDGDGSLYFIAENNTFHLSITSHYLTITNNFRDIVYQLLNTPERSKKHSSTFYNNTAKFTLNGLEAYKLASLLYENANTFCQRKYEKYLLAKQKFA